MLPRARQWTTTRARVFTSLRGITISRRFGKTELPHTFALIQSIKFWNVYCLDGVQGGEGGLVTKRANRASSPACRLTLPGGDDDQSEQTRSHPGNR